MKKVKKPQVRLKELKQLLSLTKHYGWRLPLALACNLIGSLTVVSAAVFLQLIIDEGITPMITGQVADFAILKGMMLKLSLVFGIGIVASYIATRTMVLMAQHVTHNVRRTLFNHLEHLPMSYFRKQSRGDVMSRFSNDVDTLVDTFGYAIPSAFSATVTLIAVVASMFYLDTTLTGMILLSMVIMVTIIRLIGKRSSVFFKRQQASTGKLNGYIEEMIQGQRVVKMFNYQERSLNDFNEYNGTLRADAFKANLYANIMVPIMTNIGNILYVIVAIVGGYMAIVQKTGLSIGEIAAFLQLTRSLGMPLSQLAQQMNALFRSLAGTYRIFEVLEEAKELDEGEARLVQGYFKGHRFNESSEGPDQAWSYRGRYIPCRGEVEFKNVSFNYEDGESVLKDVSFHVKPGSKLALVGPTGAGKTTIVNLISRFYERDGGQIYIDGIDVNAIAKYDLRLAIAMVLQEAYLFTGTIRENIRYGRLEASDKEVEEAAKLANVHDFILDQPHGYESMLTADDSALSKGQRQLITIARAAVTHSPILIFDEATASVDTRTEKLVQEGMDRLMKDRTSVIIAHRLSTIRDADLILVLYEGRIIEQGNHETLMNEKGFYYGLNMGVKPWEDQEIDKGGN